MNNVKLSWLEYYFAFLQLRANAYGQNAKRQHVDRIKCQMNKQSKKQNGVLRNCSTEDFWVEKVLKGQMVYKRTIERTKWRKEKMSNNQLDKMEYGKIVQRKEMLRGNVLNGKKWRIEKLSNGHIGVQRTKWIMEKLFNGKNFVVNVLDGKMAYGKTVKQIK